MEVLIWMSCFQDTRSLRGRGEDDTAIDLYYIQSRCVLDDCLQPPHHVHACAHASTLVPCRHPPHL